MSKIRFNMLLDVELHKKLRVLSKKEERTISGTIRLLIKEWIKKKEGD